MCEINRRWCDYPVAVKSGTGDRLGRNLIIRDGQVHMANLCLASCYMVNGVSRLHGEILKNDLFKDIYSIRPERFTHVTNGIDHRRWLAQINPGLDALITELLGGDEYLLKPELLEKLTKFEDDETVRACLNDIKYANKLRLCRFCQATTILLSIPTPSWMCAGRAPARV